MFVELKPARTHPENAEQSGHAKELHYVRKILKIIIDDRKSEIMRESENRKYSEKQSSKVENYKGIAA